MAAPANAPIFVDATGQRASIVRRVVRLAGALLLLYAVLVVASFARLPGTDRVSLPGVGHLFPSAIPQPTPGLGVSATPVAATHAVATHTGDSPVVQPAAPAVARPVTTATPARSTPAQPTPPAQEHTNTGVRAHGDPQGNRTSTANNGNGKGNGNGNANGGSSGNNGIGHGAGGATHH